VIAIVISQSTVNRRTERTTATGSAALEQSRVRKCATEQSDSSPASLRHRKPFVAAARFPSDGQAKNEADGNRRPGDRGPSVEISAPQT